MKDINIHNGIDFIKRFGVSRKKMDKLYNDHYKFMVEKKDILVHVISCIGRSYE